MNDVPGLPDTLMPAAVVMVGVPNDENSSFLRGPAAAPPEIRKALCRKSTNQWTESGVDLEAGDRFFDAGDLPGCSGPEGFAAVTGAVSALLTHDIRLLALGGDHAVTLPLIEAHAERYPDLTIVQFDAHPDLYDVFEGNRLSHACPFARIMEAGLARRLVQIGVRGFTRHQRDQMARFGVEAVDMSAGPVAVPAVEGPVYLSVDLDVLDPAFAPGLSHPEPGGMSTRRLIEAIHAIDAPIIGADIVEYNPRCDVNGITAMVAAKLVREVAGAMLATNS